MCLFSYTVSNILLFLLYLYKSCIYTCISCIYTAGSSNFRIPVNYSVAHVFLFLWRIYFCGAQQGNAPVKYFCGAPCTVRHRNLGFLWRTQVCATEIYFSGELTVAHPPCATESIFGAPLIACFLVVNK